MDKYISKFTYLQGRLLVLILSLLPISAPLRPSTPEKFSVPHICARFGPGGFLIKVLPNLPSEGQPALVEIHSMEVKFKRRKGGGGIQAFLLEGE